MVAQVAFEVGSKTPKVGEATAIDFDGRIDVMFSIVEFYLLPALFDVFRDMLELFEAVEHFLGAEANRLHVDAEGTFDAPAICF